MDILQDTLNQWAETTLNVNGTLVAAIHCLENGDTEGALLWLANARQANWLMKTRLVEAGAEEPMDARAEGEE